MSDLFPHGDLNEPPPSKWGRVIGWFVLGVIAGTASWLVLR